MIPKDTKNINDYIPYTRVRLIVDGEMKELSKKEALALADEQGLDLVQMNGYDEIICKEPPICKLMDYSKWLYDKEKKQKRQQKSGTKIKDLRLSWQIDEHDLNTKLKAIERMVLKEGNKVRCTMQFRGREQTKMNLGIAFTGILKERLPDGIEMSKVQRQDSTLVFYLEKQSTRKGEK